jgi:hypothetical protein
MMVQMETFFVMVGAVHWYTKNTTSYSPYTKRINFIKEVSNTKTILIYIDIF